MNSDGVLQGKWRKSFAKIEQIVELPNLIDIQRKSYERFLQSNIRTDKREDVGLQSVFKSVFPIQDFNETSSLEFVKYTLWASRNTTSGNASKEG